MRQIIVLVLILIIAGSFLIEAPEDKIVFLDVGQGDAILLQNSVHQVLIDGGRGMTVLTRLAEEMPWFDRRIEVVIATHPDQDHLAGLFHVLDRYEVGLVLLPQMPHDSHLQRAWLERLQDKMDEQGTAYRFAWAGQQLSLGDGVRLTLVGPMVEHGALYAPGKKTNNASVMARVDFHDLSLLLTSDAEAVVERALVAQRGDNLLSVDVLKAGHHGSKTSTTAELLVGARPSAVVISVGPDNRYGHPHPAVLDRLQAYRTWRTDEDGSVRFVRADGSWLVR